MSSSRKPARSAAKSPGASAPAPKAQGDDTTRTVLDSLRRLVRVFRVVGEGGGPSPAQRFVLERLAECPGASIGELARITHTDQSSVSVVVSRLVDAGYVERRRSTDDARRAELSLTARGRLAARRSVPSGQARLIAALASLPGPRRQAVARELEVLIGAMGLDDEPAGMFFEKPTAPSPGKPARKGAGRGARRTTSASKTSQRRR
jgi:DNA-binding MarR family transcriptional regulator